MFNRVVAFLRSVPQSVKAVAFSGVLAVSVPAHAAVDPAMEDAINGLVGGVVEGVTVVIASVVPLLVLVFGVSFAIRWVSAALRK
jgi:hypothetical protein